MKKQKSLAELVEVEQAISKRAHKLDLTRGQPSDQQFELSRQLFETLSPDDFISEEGIDVRNYPGSLQGLSEARKVFSTWLSCSADKLIVASESSLDLMSRVLKWYLLAGTSTHKKPWCEVKNRKFVCLVPGYDRHFQLSLTLGFELVSCPIQDDGPDMEKLRALVKDPSVLGMWIVPKFSNPTGSVLSAEKAREMASLQAACADFKVFADQAYVIHSFREERIGDFDLMNVFQDSPNPDSLILFGSTAKVTYPGGSLSFMACSHSEQAHLLELFSKERISWNKIEQLRCIRFFQNYPGGIQALMNEHAEILRPKFDAVDRILSERLGESGQFATWTKPDGGYFVSLDTKPGLAKKVVERAANLGVKLTPAGATFPYGNDPLDSNIRIAPSRPPLKEVEVAIEVLAHCIEYETLVAEAG